MNGRAHGQLRRSQVITTFGPGALIDLPNDSAIVAGLDTWGGEANLQQLDEPRLAAKLRNMTGVPTVVSRFLSWNPPVIWPDCSVGGFPGMTEQSGHVAVAMEVSVTAAV